MATHEVDKPNETRTITSLKPEGVDEIGKQLRSLLADVFALYLKTKNFHWHMHGSHFRDYHLLLDERGLGRLDFRHAGEACDSVHTDFSYIFLRAVSADEVPRLDLADDLEVGALGERSCVFGGLAKPTQRCQVVRDSQSPVSRFFQVRLVASARTVSVELFRVVRDSASEPR